MILTRKSVPNGFNTFARFSRGDSSNINLEQNPPVFENKGLVAHKYLLLPSSRSKRGVWFWPIGQISRINLELFWEIHTIL